MKTITLPTKVRVIKAMVFPVVTCRYESQTIKNSLAEHQGIDAFKLWCWRRLLKSLLDCKEIKSVYPGENQPWVFIGRTDFEAEAPVFWPPDAKSQLIGKDPDAGKDWRRRGQQRMRWLNGITNSVDMNEFGETLGDSEGQRNLSCFNPWDHKESDTTLTTEQQQQQLQGKLAFGRL